MSQKSLKKISTNYQREFELEGPAEGGSRRAGSQPPAPQDVARFLPHACRQLQAPFNLEVTVQFQGNLDYCYDRSRRLSTRVRLGRVAEGGSRRAGSQPPAPQDVARFLPHACRQLQAPFNLEVAVQFQEDYSGGDKRRREGPGSGSPPGSAPCSVRSQTASLAPADSLALTAVLDPAGAVVELAATRIALPCLLLKCIAIAAAHQSKLTRLTLRACRLEASALHTLIQLLPNSNIGELCLDDSPTRMFCYHLFLEQPSKLACLSLDRCFLGDRGAEAIAECLQHPRPAACSLRVLSLASNDIGDAGAGALGAALRSNRGLQRLNLADNRISDAGAARIFDSLTEFEMTQEEIYAFRRRLMERLRRRQSIYARLVAELRAEPRAEPRVSAGPARRARGVAAVSSVSFGDKLTERAEAATEQLLGPSADPFAAKHTHRARTRPGRVRCTGNRSLRWLNLAYNGLGQASLVSLKRVLSSQAELRPPPPVPSTEGLVRVVLDGNPLPESEEFYSVGSLMDEALDRATQRPPRKATTARSRRFTNF